jgi:hypothetical protein
MPWIVDGDNVLGSRRDEARKRRLAQAVAGLARRLGRPILVVFDGPSPGVPFPGEVIWSGAGTRADDVIRSRVVGSTDPRGWTIVTDDRPLGDRCRTAGARVVRCAAFRREIDEPAATGEKPEGKEDLEYWTSIFSGDSSA